MVTQFFYIGEQNIQPFLITDGGILNRFRNLKKFSTTFFKHFYSSTPTKAIIRPEGTRGLKLKWILYVLYYCITKLTIVNQQALLICIIVN